MELREDYKIKAHVITMTNEKLMVNVQQLLNRYKYEDNRDGHLNIKILDDSKRLIGFLEPCQSQTVKDTSKLVLLLAKWRKENMAAFPAHFAVTPKKIAEWYNKSVVGDKSRILFIIKTADNKPIGHVGLWYFDYDNASCELDTLVRGEKNVQPGLMTLACQTLIRWIISNIKIEKIYGYICEDNEHAIRFWEKVGFKRDERVPVVKNVEGGVTTWTQKKKDSKEKTDKYWVKIMLKDHRKYLL